MRLPASAPAATAALALGLVGAAALPTLPAAAAARSHACAGNYGPDGTPGGHFYRRIRATHTGCATANRVTRAWVRYEAMHDGADPTGRVRVLAYTCRGRTVPDGAESSGIAVRCTRGARIVTFFGHG